MRPPLPHPETATDRRDFLRRGGADKMVQALQERNRNGGIPGGVYR